MLAELYSGLLGDEVENRSLVEVLVIGLSANLVRSMQWVDEEGKLTFLYWVLLLVMIFVPFPQHSSALPNDNWQRVRHVNGSQNQMHRLSMIPGDVDCASSNQRMTSSGAAGVTSTVEECIRWSKCA